MDYELEFKDKDAAWFVHNQIRRVYKVRGIDYTKEIYARGNVLRVSEMALNEARRHIASTGARVTLRKLVE